VADCAAAAEADVSPHQAARLPAPATEILGNRRTMVLTAYGMRIPITTR